MKKAYSDAPRSEVLAEVSKYAHFSRADLHVARNAAIRRRDWLTMQAITYVLSITYTEKKEK